LGDVRLADVLAHQPRRIGTVILDDILQAVAEHNRGYHPDHIPIMVVLA
jgi:hypothetical protein